MGYLEDRATHQGEPGLWYEGERVKDAVQQNGGATAIWVPDPTKPHHIRTDLYYGETTPGAEEVPHWHTEQTEAYIMVDGKAEAWVKWRWEPKWQRRVLKKGDVILMQPEVCHWFRWLSEEGRAAVFKASPTSGVGQHLNGKRMCANCPHYEHGCTPPGGFNPETSRTNKK